MESIRRRRSCEGVCGGCPGKRPCRRTPRYGRGEILAIAAAMAIQWQGVTGQNVTNATATTTFTSTPTPAPNNRTGFFDPTVFSAFVIVMCILATCVGAVVANLLAKARRRRALRPLREQNPSLYRLIITSEAGRLNGDVFLPPGTAITPAQIRQALNRTDPFLLQTFRTFVWGAGKEENQGDGQEEDGKGMGKDATVEMVALAVPEPAALKPDKGKVLVEGTKRGLRDDVGLDVVVDVPELDVQDSAPEEAAAVSAVATGDGSAGTEEGGSSASAVPTSSTVPGAKQADVIHEPSDVSLHPPLAPTTTISTDPPPSSPTSDTSGDDHVLPGGGGKRLSAVWAGVVGSRRPSAISSGGWSGSGRPFSSVEGAALDGVPGGDAASVSRFHLLNELRRPSWTGSALSFPITGSGMGFSRPSTPSLRSTGGAGSPGLEQGSAGVSTSAGPPVAGGDGLAAPTSRRAGVREEAGRRRSFFAVKGRMTPLLGSAGEASSSTPDIPRWGALAGGRRGSTNPGTSALEASVDSSSDPVAPRPLRAAPVGSAPVGRMFGKASWELRRGSDASEDDEDTDGNGTREGSSAGGVTFTVEDVDEVSGVMDAGEYKFGELCK
ncbi:hypothetical protein M427DRAFT_148557 [Gonapodya prolifera JEL478]|uniref:Uncharacterized protein n=1 Tax=Gonapodya prolifera (strain JEL478) TaxID=1344416 RepID=A0A139A1Q0_GONPJ|nr:hypothetical protein M427DRAFT_148557 [Gonapodya prolifera JEL478]|eukprot:KXS10558.1 hypothetical protein M427DRAFT_148557 [Gonapodya prolifera JEL478]